MISVEFIKSFGSNMIIISRELQ